jgi:hypothetical protein
VYRGESGGEPAVYVNYCHQCGRALSSARAARCERCAWLRCECGACGCTYQMPSPRPVLATVPRGWSVIAAQHLPARPAGHAARRHWPVLLSAVILACGLIALVWWALPEHAVAPEAGTVSQPVAASTPVQAAAPPALEPAVPPAVAGEQPSPLPSPTLEPSPTASPAAPSATPLPAVLYVANTDGQGVYLRTQPRDDPDTRIVAWREGTPFTPLETTTVQEPGGPALWVRVRDPNGQIGWVRARYLAASR